MGIGIQLGLLLWKNFTYRWRQKVQLIIEILWPLFLFFILVVIRKSNPSDENGECHFQNKALPSAGTISWIRDVFCTDYKLCFEEETAGEAPGIVENVNDSFFFQFLANIRNIIRLLNDTKIQDGLSKLSASLRRLNHRSTHKSAMKVKAYLKKNETFSQFIRTNTSLPPELVDELLGSRLDLQVFSRAGLPLKQVACSQSILYQFLVARDAGLAKHLQEALCSLPEPTLQALERSFISEVDWAKLFRKQLTSGSAQVMNAVESLWSLLQRAESEVSSMASFVGFLEALRGFSGRASDSNPLLAFKSAFKIICGSMTIEHSGVFTSDIYQERDFESFPRHFDKISGHFCREFFTEYRDKPISRILFVGKILYTPPTLATQKVMAEVNRTFQSLAKVHDVKAAWDELGPQIYAFMEKSPEMRAIQNLLSTPGVVQVLEQRLGGSFWNISNLRNFLSAQPEEQVYTWHKAYAQVDRGFSSMSNLVKCMTLDKIEAVASEEELIRRAIKLVRQKKFWAGIVFLLPGDQSRSLADLPPHVQFKIRMSIKDVRPTNMIREWSWNPDYEADPEHHMQYVRSGFVYIQDLVEQAVVRVQMGTATHQHRTGIYIQQMPYPCYVDDAYVFTPVMSGQNTFFISDV